MKIIITESRLKEMIFKKLYHDLSHAEIIPGIDNAVWLLNKNKLYWYLELFEDEWFRRVFYRDDFFTPFFRVFSMGRKEFEPILDEWAEEVFNSEIDRIHPEIMNKVDDIKAALNNQPQ